jgi:hypothetical protein
MRIIPRALFAALAVTTLILTFGASTALAGGASSTSKASVQQYQYDDSWCFDDGWQVNCTVSHATLAVTITPDGRDIARIHFNEQVVSFQNGVQVGEYSVRSFDRTVFGNGGQDSTFTVSHLRARADGSSCNYTYLLKIVDYELQLEHLNGPTCS